MRPRAVSGGEVLDALAGALRAEGLDVHHEQGDGPITIGTALRGDQAVPVRLRLDEHELLEYLDHLAAAHNGDDPAEYAFGMLLMLLIEAVTSVHDGENNLVTEVELRRGADHRLGLHETRLDGGPPLLPPGERYGWTADRPR